MQDRKLVVLWAGNAWDGLPATDHHLATALARTMDVLWVDPPLSVHTSRRVLPRVEQVAEGLRVVQVSTIPFASRRGVRQLAEAHQRAVLSLVTALAPRRPWASITLSPRVSLAAHGAGRQLLHVTDDWIAGAGMMGLDPAWMESQLRRNVQLADVVCAVSPDLARDLQQMGPRRPVVVVPNGATIPEELPQVEHEPIAVLVGQLNERLDLDVLQGIVDAGVPLRILGPRADRDADFGARLDALLARPEVDWRGPVSHEELAPLLAGARVGITPYAVNTFNQSSFPLKTLEYLSLGLPVVSSRLESLNWLDTDLVDVAQTPAHFAELVRDRVGESWDEPAATRRRAFADQHSWQARADALLQELEAI